ncbi:MAG TPA: hypothetical protein VGN44_07635 [Candidatus Angelobacter sp.]|jgi:uncharacterized membrane protein YphA (DoxX/SURF4 family)
MIRSLATIGRCFFAITMIVFGLQQCAFAVLRSGQIFGPPWIVRNPFLIGVIGIVLVLAGLSIAIQYKARLGAQFLASVLLVYVIAIYLPRIIGSPRNPGFWTSAAELLCLAGAAFVAAGASQGTQAQASEQSRALINTGRFLYALPLVVFAAQHFMYAQFVAMLVPAWIPARLFWACFVGAAFIAASLSIIFKIKSSLAAALLGLMFFLWVVIVHAPRIALASHSANEWTSGLVALAMSGGAFMMADEK